MKSSGMSAPCCVQIHLYKILNESMRTEATASKEKKSLTSVSGFKSQFQVAFCYSVCRKQKAHEFLASRSIVIIPLTSLFSCSTLIFQRIFCYWFVAALNITNYGIKIKLRSKLWEYQIDIGCNVFEKFL